MKSLAVLLTALVLAAGRPDVSRAVIARVNGEPITEAELKAVVAERRVELAQAYRGAELEKRVAEEYGAVLKDLIEQRLLVQAAQRELSREDRERIERRFDEFTRKNPERIQALLRRARRRPTVGKLAPAEREELVSLLMVEEVVRRRTKFDSLRLSPKSLWSYYNSHKKDFHVPERLTVRMIYVEKAFYETPEKARGVAKEAHKKLQAGVDFAALARAYSNGPNASEGGLWKDVRSGVLRPEIEKLVRGLKPNETSRWIATQDGYFVARLVSRTAAHDIPFEDAQEDIKRHLAHAEIVKNVSLWLTELKKAARIEILRDKRP